MIDFGYEFIKQKLSRVYVFFYAIYMEIMRVWLKRDHVYTIDDLEGGAYDGDNSLVVKCFAQRLRKGAAKLDVNGRTPDGKTPLMCCFEGLLKADSGEIDRQLQIAGKPTFAQRTGLMSMAKVSLHKRNETKRGVRMCRVWSGHY